MKFNAANLKERAQNWLNICRESMHNTNNPQLKNLLHIEVVALESMIAGLDAGRYVVVDKTDAQVSVLRDVYEKKKPKFGAPSEKEFEMVDALEKIDNKLHQSIMNRCADGVFHSPFKGLGFPIKETPLPAGIDFAIMGSESTVFSRVTYANGEIKREVISTEDVNRDRLAELTKLSPVQVRLIISANPNASTHDIVYMCLKRYGESLAGKGVTVEEASTYYADYHIDRVMKELGE